MSQEQIIDAAYQALYTEIWNAGFRAGREGVARFTTVKYDDMQDGKLYRVTIEGTALMEYGYYGASDPIGCRLSSKYSAEDEHELIERWVIEEHATQIEEIN